ncbi:DUF4249 family protein [Flagellimonas algicola]|uniref:DUF4249 family protein n=1 Tax=Flagellimonas algicola TaxID=2583815 RepID=A0ABY2WQ89_9FLAO|nr:DUF4249 family protein [Allomuricauda algicola]TMU56847.1 DUF4249 family protein [Allomuricauda algicola]
MRSIAYCIFLFALLSCEEVIEVEVPSEEPRLIVDALVRVDPTSNIVDIEVRVGLTDAFFGEIPVTNLKQITLAGGVLVDYDNPGSGIYKGTRSAENLKASEELLLQLEWEDKLYYGSTTYASSVPIDDLRIGSNTLFDEDETEIIITITDDPNRNDFYVVDLGFGNFITLDDQFFQGQQFSFSYFYDEKFEPGQEITVSVLGADQAFYNYMNLLIEQTEDDLGVFETPTATLRGNIFDVTELDNIDFFDNVNIPNEFLLGYFAVVEEYKQSITIP